MIIIALYQSRMIYISSNPLRVPFFVPRWSPSQIFFYDALEIRKKLKFVLRQPIPGHVLTDSKSLLCITSERNRTNENRIMSHIHAARQAYKAQQISNVGFVRSSHSLTDGLTKPKVQPELYQQRASSYQKPKVEKWIIRDSQWCIVHHYPVRRHEAHMVYL